MQVRVFQEAYKIHAPNTKQTFTMLLPRTLPIATPTASALAVLNTATVNSGSEVDKAMSIKPTAVFPNPVISAILSLLTMVQWLKLLNSTSDNTRIPALIITGSTKEDSLQKQAWRSRI